MVVSNRNLLFQGSIFRCYVSFREGIPYMDPMEWFFINPEESAIIQPHRVTRSNPMVSLPTYWTWVEANTNRNLNGGNAIGVGFLKLWTIEFPGTLAVIFENFSRSLQTKIGRWQLTFHIKKTQLSFEHVESVSCLISIGFIVSQPVDCVQEQYDRMDAYFSPPPTKFWVVWMGNFVPVILWKFRVA